MILVKHAQAPLISNVKHANPIIKLQVHYLLKTTISRAINAMLHVQMVNTEMTLTLDAQLAHLNA